MIQHQDWLVASLIMWLPPWGHIWKHCEEEESKKDLAEFGGGLIQLGGLLMYLCQCVAYWTS